jgi:hypothetical protein
VIAQRTRKILWTRAADRCAICRCKLTKDPRHDADREAVLGAECHIIARGKGGPRSDAIKPRELDDYRNLILLCPTHHKEVDDQPNEYTIETLQEIKRKHEEWVDETLEWRAGLPDSLWAKLKEEAEALLLARAEEVDGDVGELLEHLGIFVLMTADLLGAPELVFFVHGQGGGASLAFKFEKDSVFFAHAEFDGFEAGFSVFDLAPAIEVQTEDIRAFLEEGSTENQEGENEMEVFTLAASALLQLTEQIESGQAVFYIRGTPPTDTPQLAFRVEEGEVLFAAGPTGTFDEAHDDFAAAEPVDVTEIVRVRMLLDTYTDAMERGDDDMRLGLFANYFAISVLPVLGETLEATDTEKTGFAGLIRNRFYEALLMLRTANESLDDPRVRAWAEEHADPQPKDGFTAVLPIACREAVDEFAEQAGLADQEKAELRDEAVDQLHEAISLFSRFDDDIEVQESIAAITLERIKWWREPEARSEILKMTPGAASAD